MVCTRREALLILRRWCERKTPLILNCRLAGEEAVTIKGRIAGVALDNLHFYSAALSVNVSLDQVAFEYDEDIKDQRALQRTKNSSSAITLHLSLPIYSASRDIFTEPDTTLSIYEIAA
jgi:hypothetical protein